MNTSKRHYSVCDLLLLSFDQGLKTLTDHPKRSGVLSPSRNIKDPTLTETERKHSAALMRINHAGEICAQALYHAQGLVSKNKDIQEKMEHAAKEEGDHLAWCKQRLDELGSHPSYLNPFWYTGSFCIGLVAGMIGDPWSLGFVAETERQVVKHLEGQLCLLPIEDQKSFSILKQMEMDEALHRDDAEKLGAHPLPSVIQHGMSMLSQVMVKVSYWV
jgi:ubiquinone biosynthesis monooxygenase Coq7